jgi:hypothetical protein
MFTDFMTVIPQTHSTVLITYRPEYRGAYMPGAQTISLAPLTDSDTTVARWSRADPVAAIRTSLPGGSRQPFFAQRWCAARRTPCEGAEADMSVAWECGSAHAAGSNAARIDRLDAGANRR